MKYPISQIDFHQDFASFVELSQQIYGEKAVTDEAMYRWLFANNRYNPQGTHFFHIAKDGERVVASDCLLPVPLVIHGQRFLAAWSVKTMTHPSYQRQGIFKAMTEYNISRARELGIDLILGFANANSFPGYKKFGWDILFERRAVVRPLDIKRSLAKRKLFKPFALIGNTLYQAYDRKRISALRKKTGEFSAEILPAAPDCIQEIWAKMEAAVPMLIERDWAYLNWRYNQRPRQDYKFVLAREEGKPEAMLIFRTSAVNSSCIIIDYIGAPKSRALPALFSKTIDYCLQKDIRYLINSSSILFDNHLIKNFGFKHLAAPMANNMFIACRLNDAIDLDSLHEETNWFFSYGDSELDIDLQPS